MHQQNDQRVIEIHIIIIYYLNIGFLIRGVIRRTDSTFVLKNNNRKYSLRVSILQIEV